MKNCISKYTADILQSQYIREEVILLESQSAQGTVSGQSYLAAKPASSISAYGNHIERIEDGQKQCFEMDPWEALKAYQSEKKNWLFGYLGYDLKNYLENLESSNEALVNMPDFYFMEPSVLLQMKGGAVKPILGSKPKTAPSKTYYAEGQIVSLVHGMDRQEYINTVKTIQERIKEGDFYELNYSFPLIGEYRGDPYWLYSQMRNINPVPFGGFFRCASFSVCCASPERFLKKTGRRIISQPIKGTSPRSDNTERDKYYKNLLLNEKNRAENLMIVDLVRNDFSRVAETGSVKVPTLFEMQSFETVHQLISTVEARVREGINPVDVIQACFPMGSMTGAPKIPVMKTIDELENYKRGIYSGAIGYFKPNGDFDFNVVIRSAIIQGQRLIYPAGGAITSDSEPAEEWEETQVKSRNITNVYV